MCEGGLTITSLEWPACGTPDSQAGMILSVNEHGGYHKDGTCFKVVIVHPSQWNKDTSGHEAGSSYQFHIKTPPPIDFRRACSVHILANTTWLALIKPCFRKILRSYLSAPGGGGVHMPFWRRRPESRETPRHRCASRRIKSKFLDSSGGRSSTLVVVVLCPGSTLVSDIIYAAGGVWISRNGRNALTDANRYVSIIVSQWCRSGNQTVHPPPSAIRNQIRSHRPAHHTSSGLTSCCMPSSRTCSPLTSLFIALRMSYASSLSRVGSSALSP